jgi:multidrug resistance protein, MATE family
MAAVLMMFTLKYVRVKIYEPKFKIKPVDIHLIKKLINIGLPSGFQYLLEVGAFSFGAIMIGWIGAKQLAAHQIAISLASATYMVILGIASAGTIRVGDAVGKKSTEQIRSAGFSAIGLASAVMLTFAVIFFLCRKILPAFYNTNPEVIEIASVLLIIAGLFQLFDGLQATGIGVLRGLTDVKIPLLISILSYWVIAMPISYLLGFVFNFGAVGIWVGLLLGLATLGITMLFRFNNKSKKIFSDEIN